MSELIDTLMEAKAALESIGPIQTHIDMTFREYCELKRAIPTVTVTGPTIDGLKVRITDEPEWYTGLRRLRFDIPITNRTLLARIVRHNPPGRPKCPEE